MAARRRPYRALHSLSAWWSKDEELWFSLGYTLSQVTFKHVTHFSTNRMEKELHHKLHENSVSLSRRSQSLINLSCSSFVLCIGVV